MKMLILSVLLISFSAIANEELDKIVQQVCNGDSKCNDLLKIGELSNIVSRMSIGQYHMIDGTYSKVMEGGYIYAGFPDGKSKDIMSKLKKINDEKKAKQDDQGDRENQKKIEDYDAGSGAKFIKELKDTENEFEKIDLAEIKNNFTYEALDKIKDKYFDYLETANALTRGRKMLKVRNAGYYDSTDLSILHQIQMPEKGVSFRSQDLDDFKKSILELSFTPPKNTVFKKVYELLKDIVPVMDNYDKSQEEKAEGEKNAQNKIHEAENKKLEELQSTSSCKKTVALSEYCRALEYLNSTKEALKYEAEVTKRSGVSNLAKRRSQAQSLMMLEEQIAKHSKTFNSLKAKVPALNSCKTVRDKNGSANHHLTDESTKMIESTLMKNCGAANFSP